MVRGDSGEVSAGRKGFQVTAEKCACVFCEALIAQWPPRHCQWCYDNCTMACDMEDPEGNVVLDPRRELLHKVGFRELEHVSGERR